MVRLEGETVEARIQVGYSDDVFMAVTVFGIVKGTLNSCLHYYPSVSSSPFPPFAGIMVYADDTETNTIRNLPEEACSLDSRH